MGAFILEVFDNYNDPYYAVDVKLSLINLNQTLDKKDIKNIFAEGLKDAAIPGIQYINSGSAPGTEIIAINFADYTAEQLQPYLYPRLWQSDSGERRVTASTVTYKKEFLAEKGVLGHRYDKQKKAVVISEDNSEARNLLSAHELIIKDLKKLRKSFKFFLNKEQREEKRKIKKLIDETIEAMNCHLEEAVLRYLYSLLRQNEIAIRKDLNAVRGEEQAKEDEFKKQMDGFFGIFNGQPKLPLLTEIGSLEFTNKASKLSTNIKKHLKKNKLLENLKKLFSKSSKSDKGQIAGSSIAAKGNPTPETKAERLTRRSAQLGIISNLLADPFVNHPEQRTTLDYWRMAIRILATLTIIVCAVVAIFAFIYFPPGLALCLLIGKIAFGVLVGDDAFKMGRQLLYGQRSPNKKDAYPYLIMLFIAPGAVLSQVPIVTAKISQVSVWIGKHIVQLVPKLGTKINQAFVWTIQHVVKLFAKLKAFFTPLYNKLHNSTGVSNVINLVQEMQPPELATNIYLAGLNVRKGVSEVKDIRQEMQGKPTKGDFLKLFIGVEAVTRGANSIFREATRLLKEWEGLQGAEALGKISEFVYTEQENVEELLGKIIAWNKQHAEDIKKDKGILAKYGELQEIAPKLKQLQADMLYEKAKLLKTEWEGLGEKKDMQVPEVQSVLGRINDLQERIKECGTSKESAVSHGPAISPDAVNLKMLGALALLKEIIITKDKKPQP